MQDIERLVNHERRNEDGLGQEQCEVLLNALFNPIGSMSTMELGQCSKVPLCVTVRTLLHTLDQSRDGGRQLEVAAGV